MRYIQNQKSEIQDTNYEKKLNSKIVIANMFTVIPASTLAKITHTNLVIPYYHMVSDHTVLHIKHLYPHKNIKQFISDMDFLLKEFNPITLTELIKYLRNGQKLPNRAFLLTFDDGFREMHDIVSSILLRKGIPATFFISSSFINNCNLCFQHKASVVVENILQKNVSPATRKQIDIMLFQHDIKTGSLPVGIISINYLQRRLVDRIAELLDIDFNDYLLKNKPYMTTEQIQKMLHDGFTIGAHSIDHPLYANLSEDEQIRQTTESIKFVKNEFNLDYRVFAFPHSDLGVSKKYFSEIEQRDLVDISFGTAGIREDSIPNHFQRFSMEKPLLPAKNIVAYQQVRRLWRIIKHIR